MTQDLLKLFAQDEQDIQVLAAVLQDAIVPVCDMAFEEKEKNFVMVVHRFRWDRLGEEGETAQPPAEASEDCFERVHCALNILGAEGAQYSGFDPNDPALMLDLLTILLEDGHLVLIFAGGGKLRIKLHDWRLRLEDFGESWPVKHKPRHPT